MYLHANTVYQPHIPIFISTYLDLHTVSTLNTYTICRGMGGGLLASKSNSAAVLAFIGRPRLPGIFSGFLGLPRFP